jgi:hypothetical protein
VTKPTLDEEHEAVRLTYQDLDALEAAVADKLPEIPQVHRRAAAQAIVHGVCLFKWGPLEAPTVVALGPALMHAYRIKLDQLVARRR